MTFCICFYGIYLMIWTLSNKFVKLYGWQKGSSYSDPHKIFWSTEMWVALCKLCDWSYLKLVAGPCRVNFWWIWKQDRCKAVMDKIIIYVYKDLSSIKTMNILFMLLREENCFINVLIYLCCLLCVEYVDTVMSIRHRSSWIILSQWQFY